MIDRPHGTRHENEIGRIVTISLYPHPLIYAKPDWDIGHPACEAVYEKMIELIEEARGRFNFSFTASLGIHDQHSPRVYVEVILRGYDAREAADYLIDI